MAWHPVRRNRTSSVVIHSMIYRGRTVHVIDTPGSNDTEKSDCETLQELTYWLTAAYENNIHLSGLIYLHRITDVRLQGTALQSLNVLKMLCGAENYCGIVLTTTGWEEVARSQEQMSLTWRRHQELLEKDQFWSDIKRAGGQVVPLTAPEIDIVNILRHIPEKDRKLTLSFQYQLAKEKRSMHETDAGRILYDAVSSPSFCNAEHELLEAKGNWHRNIIYRISQDEEELGNLMKSIRASIEPLEKDLTSLRCDAGSLQATWDEYLQKDFESRQEDTEMGKMVLENEEGEEDARVAREIHWDSESRERRVGEKLGSTSRQSIRSFKARKHKVVKISPTSKVTALSVVGASLAAGQLIAAVACTVM